MSSTGGSEAMTLRALIVGCGRIAGGYNASPDDAMVLTHALAYGRHPGYALAACVDPDAAARAAFAGRWAVPAAFDSLEAALAAETYDIVSVCAPTETHLDLLERLSQAPAPRVFAEKPLGAAPVRARALADRFRAQRRALAVNFTRRWDAEMVRLREEIAADQWGALRSAVGWYGRGILNNGSHMIDLVAFLTARAARPVRVVKARDDGVRGDPTVDAVLDLDGAPFHLVGCDGRDHARFELTLSFAQGVVEILEGGLFVRRRPLTRSTVFPDSNMAADATREATGYGQALLRALDELAAWAPGRPLASDADSALASIALASELRDQAAMGVAA